MIDIYTNVETSVNQRNKNLYTIKIYSRFYCKIQASKNLYTIKIDYRFYYNSSIF